ncbi:MAG: GMP synthase (glutamine-hydrolyzing) [Syntrophus sp. PtaB.Bin138]|jgi:GMP synthase-like glutamine amidotransferase|uniref:type 1 glutamine amidotransferase n=1 Tax=Syntrophus sp. (in: bacteria) TaxID=48412 RepID=UPI0009D15C86|nr:MAG: GMP synthase (glutamine-hydrolyzing) [Syntrophus sp. PtaB.Bin138]
MRAHYFQHVPFEGLGSIEPWLGSKGYDLTGTRFFEAADLPDRKEIDLLVIMGGPMSVNDEGRFPWLSLEKNFVREMIESGKPVLGICLGAQLIANAMGAQVTANPEKEIGWFPIHAVTPVDDDAFRFPPSETVFHWHGETFDLPARAIRLARSEGCGNQAFQLGKQVIGLQFHLETTPNLAQDLVFHCREEIVPSRYVQTAEEILSVSPSRYQSVNDLMSGVLSYLVR